MISDTISHLILTIMNLDMKFNLIHSKMFDLEKRESISHLYNCHQTICSVLHVMMVIDPSSIKNLHLYKLLSTLSIQTSNC